MSVMIFSAILLVCSDTIIWTAGTRGLCAAGAAALLRPAWSGASLGSAAVAIHRAFPWATRRSGTVFTANSWPPVIWCTRTGWSSIPTTPHAPAATGADDRPFAKSISVPILAVLGDTPGQPVSLSTAAGASVPALAAGELPSSSYIPTQLPSCPRSTTTTAAAATANITAATADAHTCFSAAHGTRTDAAGPALIILPEFPTTTAAAATIAISAFSSSSSSGNLSFWLSY